MTTALTLLLAAACGGNARREYRLQGQVLAVSADHREATIRHEEIAGFMGAMTMPYRVKEAKEFEPLVAGDLISATLVVLEREAYLERVKKVGNAPLEVAPGAAVVLPSGVQLVPIGAPVPEGSFVTQDGASVSLADYRGQAVVVTFMYSSCPLPDFCPLMDANFQTMQKRLLDDRNQLRAHLLSVTLDPHVDTPPVLKAHGARLGADPRLWTFLTGDIATLDAWAARLGIAVSRAANDPRDITHNLRTLLIDRQGNLVQAYSGNSWKPEQVLADLKVMVGVD